MIRKLYFGKVMGIGFGNKIEFCGNEIFELFLKMG